MKTKNVATIGTILSLVILLIWVTSTNQEDHNTLTLYLFIYSIPAIIVALLNGLYIYFIAKLSKPKIKIALSFIPLIILIVLSFQNDLSLTYFDSSLSFLCQFSAISLGITNLIWIITNSKKESPKDKEQTT